MPIQSDNILSLDHTQVFPLLQYLEALYYAYSIITFYANNQTVDAQNIVFLVPNKEFTYYLVEGEENPLETFRQNIQEILNLSGIYNNKFPITLHFLPFSYGSDFYAGPFDEQGASIEDMEELICLLLVSTNMLE